MVVHSFQSRSKLQQAWHCYECQEYHGRHQSLVLGNLCPKGRYLFRAWRQQQSQSGIRWSCRLGWIPFVQQQPMVVRSFQSRSMHQQAYGCSESQGYHDLLRSLVQGNLYPKDQYLFRVLHEQLSLFGIQWNCKQELIISMQQQPMVIHSFQSCNSYQQVKHLHVSQEYRDQLRNLVLDNLCPKGLDLFRACLVQLFRFGIQ